MVETFLKKIRGDANESAFALVSTLIILVIVTILAVGFMTTSSLERSSSHAYTRIYDAQLAAGMGLEAAKKALSVDSQGNYTTMNDSFIVIQTGSVTTSGTPATDSNGNVLRYYFIGSGSLAASGSMINYYPLFAQTSTPSAPYFQTVSGTARPSYALTGTANVPVDPTLFSSLQPQVNLAWVTTGTATAGTPALRYTYWIEDMGGYIDADVAGNMSGTNQTHTRDPAIMQPLINSGSTLPASMIAFWSLLDGTAPLDVQGTPEDQSNTNLVTDRQVMLTPGSVLQAVVEGGTATATTVQQNVVAGLKSDVEQEIIPYGFGYANQGQPKTDLNGILTNISNSSITTDAAVTQIASAISTNLPNFASGRKGGLGVSPSTQDYNKTIAANIIGYATKSTTPVVDPNSPTAPTYRGFGAYPVVNEIADSVTWLHTYAKNTYPPPPLTGTNTTALVEIQISTYVELWNMTNQTISGTAKLVYSYVNPTSVGFNSYLNGTSPGSGSTVTVTPADPSNPTQFAPIVFSGSTALQPNEFRVINTGTVTGNTSVPPYLASFPPTFTTTYVLNSGVTSVASPLSMGQSLSSNYQLYWNNVLVDRSWKSLVTKKLNGSLTGSGTTVWQDCCATLRYTQTPGETGAYYENPGDPRASFYIYQASPTTAAELVNYANGSSFGTRNVRSNDATGPGEPIYAEVRPSVWSDSGHDSTAPSVPGAGWTTGIGTANQTPLDQVALAPATQSTMAPVVISGSGSLSSITELSNIYDPAQWNVGVVSTGTMPATLAQSGWYDIPSSATADAKYGGGFNLRIGKQEFTKFNQPGLRASQLMDIFCSGSTRQTQGLVNLNTATFNTLRALGAGLSLCSGTWNKDAAIQPTTLSGSFYPPTTTVAADKFANAIITARATSPFLSTAQLSQLKDTSGSYFFGNMSEWTSPQTAPTVWNDAASKEYFSRIYDLASVRSRNFRVYVLGQAVDQNGRVLSTAKKVYQLFLHPQRDVNGNITSQYVQVTYEKDL